MPLQEWQRLYVSFSSDCLLLEATLPTRQPRAWLHGKFLGGDVVRSNSTHTDRLTSSTSSERASEKVSVLDEIRAIYQYKRLRKFLHGVIVEPSDHERSFIRQRKRDGRKRKPD